MSISRRSFLKGLLGLVASGVVSQVVEAVVPAKQLVGTTGPELQQLVAENEGAFLSALEKDRWHQIVLTFDRGVTTLYLNNEVIATGTTEQQAVLLNNFWGSLFNIQGCPEGEQYSKLAHLRIIPGRTVAHQVDEIRVSAVKESTCLSP